MSEIIEGRLYLGPLKAAQDQGFLGKHKIKTIISCGIFNCFEHLHKGSKVVTVPSKARVLAVKNHVILPMRDNHSANQDMDYYFTVAIAEMDQAWQRGDAILVHCLKGMSRSATIVIAFLLSKQHELPLQSKTGGPPAVSDVLRFV